MPFAILIIGAVILVVAFHNTFGDLAKELTTDLPGYFTWAVAIIAILGLGYIPGLKTPSRYVLALVALVVLVTQYQKFLAGFKAFAATGSTPVAPVSSNEPTQSFISNPATTTGPSQASLSGTSDASASGTATQTASLNPFDPQAYLSPFEVHA